MNKFCCPHARAHCLGVAIAAICLLWPFDDAIGATYSSAIDLYKLTSPSGVSTARPTNSSADEIGYQGVAGGQVAGFGGVLIQSSSFTHAVFWNASGTPVDLNPSGFFESQAYASDGIHQVGGVPNDGRGFTAHAFLWNGSAGSVVDLNPNGASSSFAYGVSGNQQVGAASFGIGGNQHAILWNSTATNFVDLNPTNLPNFTTSVAYATNGLQQVGDGGNDALLWTGTADSAVDLMPASGFSRTYAYGLSSTQQVGGGYNNKTNDFNALLWNGSAGSLVNLHPAGYSDTTAVATNGSVQVGYGFTPTTSNLQALLWSGTANSVVNLGLLLPSNMPYSEAITVDAAGNVFGVARDTSLNFYAIEWSPIPEPASLWLFAGGAMTILRRRR